MFCHEFSFQIYLKQLFIKDPETIAFAKYLSIFGHDITVIYQQIFWKYDQYFLKKNKQIFQCLRSSPEVYLEPSQKSKMDFS